MTFAQLISHAQRIPEEFKNLQVKFFIQCPDERSRIIELEHIQTLDGQDGSIILQLKAKDDLPISKT